MNFYKKRKYFISLVCAILMIILMTNVPVVAADTDIDTNSVTATTSTTVKQGNTAYCYVSIDSTEGIAALDVSVHYDPAKVKVTGVYNSVSCTIYDSVTNIDNIQFSYILDGQGTASKTRLFYFKYQVLSNADVGDSYFDITIGEAYNNSLNEMEVLGSRCSFTIAEAVTSKSCSVYGSSSISTAIEQEFTLSYRFSSYQIASGTAVITYDPELFEVVEVTNGAFLNGKIVDINTELSGEIYISFVGTEYYSNTNFVSVTFKTISNVTEISKIVFKTTELIDKELNSISCSGYTTSASVVYDETHTGDSPAMRLDGSFSYEDMQITLVVSLEANSYLGAGDFVITFDPEIVTYNSCTKGFNPSFFNINDKNVEAGELKFHIISLSDIVTEETVLTVVFDVNHPYSCETADFILDGTGLTDSLTDDILLNFIDDSVWLEYQVTFCDADGTVLQSGMYHYGDTIKAPVAPTKASDNIYNYVFLGWDKELICNGNMIITAEYTSKYIDYTVVFKNWDGTELSKETYHYGDTVQEPATPTKESDVYGNYIFNGWDKKVTSCTADVTYTATYALEYKKTSITSNASSNLVVKGDKVTISATAEGGYGDYTYSYIVYNKDTKKWARVADNISSSKFTWKAGSAGNRVFYVDVKDATGKVVRSNAINVKVVNPLSVKATTTAKEVVTGGKVTITATVQGGIDSNSNSYTYSFIVYNKDTKKWARIADNIKSNTFIWKAGSVGNRVFYVDVKDSTGKVVRSEAINVSVVTKIKELGVTASASETNVKVGNSITFKATATGGSGVYTYSVIVYNRDTKKWARVADNIKSNEFAWKAKSAGKRVFYVDVKDSNGKIVRSAKLDVSVK